MKRLLFIFMTLLILLQINAKGKKALLIGISEYPSINMIGMSWDDIHGANDVDLLTPTLKKQGFSITSLKNKQATAANIRKALKQLATSTKAGDLVVISLSCHGQPVEDLNHDETDGWDEAFVPYDAMKKYEKGAYDTKKNLIKYDGSNHITDDEFNTMLKAIRKKAGSKGFVYVIADACHAGSISKGDEVNDTVNTLRGTNIGFTWHNKSYQPKISTTATIKIPYLANYANVCLLEACRSYEFSTEIKRNGKYYGPVSWYVNEALKNKSLTANTDWVETVGKAMDNDPHLQRQTLVTEKTAK